MTPKLNCSNILNVTSPHEVSSILNPQRAMWLSWGNSWISSNCNWRFQLEHSLDLRINQPEMTCLYVNIDDMTAVDQFCRHQPLIFHHSHAAEFLLSGGKSGKSGGSGKTAKSGNAPTIANICRHMLLIDKIKDAGHIKELWRLTRNSSDFIDFSPIFLNDKVEGWKIVLDRFVAWRQECVLAANLTRCEDYRRRKLTNKHFQDFLFYFGGLFRHFYIKL